MTWLGPEARLPATRVVSLVPSLTESVLRLGGRVAGRTSFCPGDAPVVGGPKDVTAARVLELEPDVVFAGESENARTTVETVAASCPVWLCEPNDPVDAPAAWRELGDILGCGHEAERAAQQTQRALDDAHRFRRARGAGPRFVCWVWRDPWVAAGRGTWISAVLESAGLQNAVSERGYPKLAEPGSLQADVHLLPSEPYAFTQVDLDGLGGGEVLATAGWYRLTSGALATLVSGEPLIWYPSHAAEGLRLARDLRTLMERP